MSFKTTITQQEIQRILCLGLMLIFSCFGLAQQIESKDTIQPTPQILKGNEIGDYDQQTRRLIADVRDLMENRQQLESIRNSVMADDSLIIGVINTLRDTLVIFSLDQLDKYENEVAVYNNKIDPWVEIVEDWREETNQFKEDIEFDKEVWTLTSDSVQLEIKELPKPDTTAIATLNRIDEQLQYNISSLSDLGDDFSSWEKDLLDTENTLTLARSELNDASDLIRRRKQNFIYNFWTPEYAPIWEIEDPAPQGTYLEEIKKTYLQFMSRANTFGKVNRDFYSRLLFGFILLAMLIIYMRTSVGKLFREHPEVAVKDNVVLKYPVISAFVIFIYACFILFDIPSQIKYLILLISILPISLLLLRLKSEIKIRYIVSFVLFALIFIYISVFTEVSQTMRIILILINMLCIYFLLSLRKDKEMIALENKYWLGTLPTLLPIFLTLSILAIIAVVIGSVQLSLVFTRTVVGTFLAYVVIKESVDLTQSFLYLLIVGPLFRVSNIVKEDSQKIYKWLERATRIGGYFYWLYLVLGLLRIRDSIIEGVLDFINSPIEMGEISIALADVLIFYIILQISIWISRFIRYLLDKEIYPRTHTDSGVASTISVLIRYTFAFLGFILALSAAGMNLDQVVVGLSALGIGIGFGLQNIVNNFVSGIILALERPISIGDVVRVDDVEGVVRDIGLRASQIRTWDGADVLVPNGSLISGKLLNWTFDDRARRLNIDIRLPLDADVEKALPIVLKAAQSVKELAKDPGPAVNYEGHLDGHSVIRVYGWISDINYFFSGGTAFRVAVFEALKKEGFEISLPVINVHMDQSPVIKTSPEEL